MCTTTVEVDSSAIVTLRATSKQALPRVFSILKEYDNWMNYYVNDHCLPLGVKNAILDYLSICSLLVLFSVILCFFDFISPTLTQVHFRKNAKAE